MEVTMGVMLRAGVATCCGIMFTGALLYLIQHGAETADYHVFRGEPPALTSIGGVLKLAATGSATGLIQLGALIMIATPVLRVVFAIFGFARLRDWRFVGISLLVLALLAIGTTH